MVKAELEEEVKGLGEIVLDNFGFVYSVVAPFDKALEELRSVGIEEPISLRDLAYARVQQDRKAEIDYKQGYIKVGVSSSLSKEDSYVKEAVIYVPKKYALFVSNSPLLDTRMLDKAVKTRKAHKEIGVRVRKYLKHAEEDKNKDPEERRVLIVDNDRFKEDGNFKIPTNRFDEDEFTLWAFKDQAKRYGEFLRNAGIEGYPVCRIGKMPVSLVSESYLSKHKKPFVSQLSLSNMLQGGGVSGFSWLYVDRKVCGVLRKLK